MAVDTQSDVGTSPRADAPVSLLETGLAFGLAAGVAALVVIPGLGTHGLWSEGELAVLDRARAALGEPLSGLERQPWLPDELRARSLAWLAERHGADFAIRLPGALASCVVVGMAAALARARLRSRRIALLAALFALALPSLLTCARTVLGNPIGELMGVTTVLLGWHALGRGHAAARVASALLGAGALALSVLSSGIVLGGAYPVLVLALMPLAVAGGWRRWVVVGLWVAALVAAGIAIRLALVQGEGYIPLLGAAKDLDLVSNPHKRGVADGLEDLGYQVFPWLPLAIVGALSPGPLARARSHAAHWPGIWLLVGLAVVSAWASVYGSTPLPLTVPTAICCAVGLAHLFDGAQTRVSRRFALLLIAGGLLIMGKDAKRDPHRVGSTLKDFPGGLGYPAARIGAERIFPGDARLSLIVLLTAFAFAPRSRPDDLGVSGRPSWLDRLGDRVPPSVRHGLPYSMAAALVFAQALHYGRIVIPRTSVQLSAKRTLSTWAQWVDQGIVPSTIAAHRIRDPGLAAYGPPAGNVVTVTSRTELMGWLSGDHDAVALIRRSELAPLHAKARQNPWNLYVLDELHHDLLLVSNFLPEGIEDQNPLYAVVFDTPPQLQHETLLRFEKYVEVIGWEIEGPVVRGRKAKLRLVLKPLRHMPAGTQIYARLWKGRMSRINSAPHELAGGVYPPNDWREGDYILHELEFEVPALEILPGPHEFIVGLRRSESKNFAITVPETESGEHGVVVKGGKREFAVLGEVDVL